jgi:hypothetical protein
MYDIGSIALLLAHKMEETLLLSPDQVRMRCGIALELKQFLTLERHMLTTLAFQLNLPTALCFLRRFSQVCGCISRRIHVMAKYLIEKCQLCFECVAWLPSVLAAACLFIAARVTLGSEFDWNAQLQFYSGYTSHQIRYFAIKVANFLKYSDNWILNATNSKYSTKANFNVSTCPTLRKLVACLDPALLL